jgi:hypothetical protein
LLLSLTAWRRLAYAPENVNLFSAVKNNIGRHLTKTPIFTCYMSVNKFSQR